MDFKQLRSPTFLIAISLSLVLFGLGVWIGRRQMPRRELTYSFLDIVYPVEIRAGEALGGDLELRFRGQPVTNLFLVRLKVDHTGNTSLRPADFVHPFIVRFPGNVTVLREPRFVAKEPVGLSVAWTGHAQAPEYSGQPAFELAFDLLKPGEGFLAEFLCTGKPDLPAVIATFDGELRLQRASTVPWTALGAAAVGAVAAAVLSFLVGAASGHSRNQREWLSLFAVLLGALLAGLAITIRSIAESSLVVR